MGIFVYQAGLQHQDEAFRIAGKRLERCAGHVRKIRLIRKLGHCAFFEKLAVQYTVHVPGVEEAQHAPGIVGQSLQLCGGGDQRVARVLEALNIVCVVLALGAGTLLGRK